MLKLCLVFIIGIWFGNMIHAGADIKKFNKYCDDNNLNLKIHKSIHDDGIVLHICRNYYSYHHNRIVLFCVSSPITIYSNYLQFMYDEFFKLSVSI